jgi:hypothetical protein
VCRVSVIISPVINEDSSNFNRYLTLMENRNGLLLQTFLTEANGRAERDAAMLMAETIPVGSA